MKLIKFGALCVALVALCATHSAADELGGNLGFEGAFGGIVAPTPGNWFGFVGPGAVGAGVNTDDPRTGLNNAAIVIAGAANSFAGLQQNVDGITVGEAYSFSFYGKTAPGPFDVGTEFRIEWLDAGGAEVSRDQLTTPFTDTYTQYSVGGSAPVGATQLRAVIALQSFQGGTTGTVRIDDTSIQGPSVAVPEPGSIALLGLGMLGLVAQRRRR
jgi:hypothetical protein